MTEERIPEKYHRLRQIRANERYAAYEANYSGKKAFIKRVVDPELKERLAIESKGLEAMRALDPAGRFFTVPHVIEVSGDYIATEWAEGNPMSDDFERYDADRIESDVDYLTRLYAFIDQSTPDHTGRNHDFGKQVDDHITELEKLSYQKYVDPELVMRTAKFVKDYYLRAEIKAANGDLQPGNIMVVDEGLPTVIDCESYRTTWPRHYIITNFVFNYGSRYPGLIPRFKTMLKEYGAEVAVDPWVSPDSFNVSAGLRSLQILIERLSGEGLSDQTVRYVTNTMQAIVDGKLFIDGAS